MTLDVLTDRALGRAMLARQGLLERRALEPVEAIQRFAGLQAQEPASPYLALWTRLHGFDRRALDDAIRGYAVVKATLMRVTLHLVAADDYRHLQPALRPTFRRRREQDVRRHGWELDLDGSVERALALAARPRTNAELRDGLPRLPTDAPGRDGWWAIRPLTPVVHVPADAPWSFPVRVAVLDADRCVPGRFAAPAEGMRRLITRYLEAFGPASLADVAQWSGVERGRLRATLDDLCTDVRTFRDERGEVLFDLPDAPLPDPETPAPARFLPMWDATLLAYEDRTRLIDREDRSRVIRANGDTLPTILVDGRVAGLWWTEPSGGGARVRWRSFRTLRPEEEQALEAEADALRCFLEPTEPLVYRRYTERWRVPDGAR